MATEAALETTRNAMAGRRQAQRPRRASGPDRLMVGLLSLGAFLVVLALLAGSLRSAPGPSGARQVRVLRKIYRTTVVETVTGAGGSAGASVTQSVSSSGSTGTAAPAPTTRTS
jgi:hypothetical protein